MTVPPPHDQPQQWPQNQPQQWPQQQQSPAGAPGSPWGSGAATSPAAAGQSRTRGTVLAVLAGFLVAALVVGGLTLAGVVRWGGSAAVDTRPVELPNTLAGMTDLVEAAAKKDTKGGGAAMKARQDRTYARTNDRYRTAFGGAATGVRTYTTEGLDIFLTVIAVRADSPGLANGPSADPADLGLAAGGGVFELDVEGDTQCLYTSSRPVKTGETMKEADRTTTVCRTVSDGLTVYVFGVGNGDGYQQMVSLARAAKAFIAGS